MIDERTLDFSVRCIGIQSAVVKRECFDLAGGFDEALPRLIDLELLVRLSDKYRFVRSPEALVNYRLGAGISSNKGALVAARRHLLHKYRDRLAQHRHHLAGQHLYLGLALQDNGERRASLSSFITAVLTAPAHARLIGELRVCARRSAAGDRPGQRPVGGAARDRDGRFCAA